MMEEGLRELALNGSKQKCNNIKCVRDHEDDDDFMGVVAETHSFFLFSFSKIRFTTRNR
jgi:hypothetical protein